jgi:hypothetical protein
MPTFRLEPGSRVNSPIRSKSQARDHARLAKGYRRRRVSKCSLNEFGDLSSPPAVSVRQFPHRPW